MVDIFNNLCRACNTQQNDLLSIYNPRLTDASPSILEMLEYCTPLSVKNSKMYPEYICFDCVKRLEISYQFLRRYNLAQQEFEVSHELLQEKENINNIHEMTVAPEGEMYEDFGKKSTVEYTVSVKDDVIVGNTDSTTNLSPTMDVTELCPLCGKTFFTEKALNLHLKIFHKQKSKTSLA
uniref:Uncharacterized protein n=1 Tax=Glossina brevipalpis TaxID=37001 RepID=A0A1A9WB07_9MUSC